MAFKDILLVLTTFPEPTPVSAVDEPIAFAVAVGARISAIACEVTFRAPRNNLAGALLDIPATLAASAVFRLHQIVAAAGRFSAMRKPNRAGLQEWMRIHWRGILQLDARPGFQGMRIEAAIGDVGGLDSSRLSIRD